MKTTAAQKKEAHPMTWMLTDERARDATRAGQKTAHLASLIAAGFPVPEGAVIPAELCGEWAQNADDVIAALSAELRGPFAVRSSATAEDLAGASFAGMYETILDVADAAGLKRAIAQVIVSADSSRVRTYDHGHGGPMAVLVQRMVPADAAGVAFTADPVTGDRDVVLVHAVSGLGDKLVSGEVDPEEWEVRAQPVCRGAASVLTAEQARAVADLARRVEEHQGQPCDIEWAFADGELWLLQARPITALPQKPDLPDLGEGTWMKDSAHMSEPLTPFGFSVYAPALQAAQESAFAEFGLMVEKFIPRSRGGELYGRILPVGGKEGKAPPAWLIGALARVIPPIRQRMNAAKAAVEGGKLESIPRDWDDHLRARMERDAGALRDVDLGALADEDLLAHLADARALLERGQREHFRLFIPYAVAVAELNFAAEELLGWEPAQTMRLVTGLSSASSAPTRALAELAALVDESAPAREALRHLDDIAQLDDVDPEIAAAFRAFEQRHGWRTLVYDPGSPTLAERPRLLARLILDRLEAAASLHDDETRAEAEAEARAALADRPDARARFEAALAAARRVYPQREDNVALTDNVPSGLLRRALLAAGERLVRRGQLERREDARWLSHEELVAALRSGDDVRALTARRYAEDLWVRAHPGPDLIGPAPHDPPDVKYLPAAGRRINRALMWFIDQELTPPAPSAGDELRGRPGSAGRVRGRACVVKTEADFGKLKPGDVLVCPITSPVWSVLFANASALVTDAGGAMSHAAIIAREHGIPAVLSTGDGTSRIKDGDVVLVDGTNGVVAIER